MLKFTITVDPSPEKIVGVFKKDENTSRMAVNDGERDGQTVYSLYIVPY